MSLGLPELVAALMVVALNAYVLTGGADFGGGVWDLFARGPRRAAQRALIANQIGPIWEANHVWLILVVVMLFTAFPAAFATLGTVLHIPLTLMLVGIVLRGSSFVFRSYGGRDDASQRRWGSIFAVASLVTPLLLGVIVAAAAMFVAAFGALAVAHVSVPEVRRELMSMTGRALAFQLATAAAALVALWALAARRWLTARAAAAAQVSLILWGWVLVQYPYIVPPSQTARAAAAPSGTLELLLGELAAGVVVLVPSLVYLYRTFAARGASRPSSR
jgi:cytochrome d ubiquinol oxidase subunit II